MANFYQSQTVVGLGTTTITVPTTDRYTIDGKITAPAHRQTTLSAVVATVNVNGSPVYTGTAGAQGFHLSPFCTAADVITIVLTSASTADQGLNTIKTTISVSEGV